MHVVRGNCATAPAELSHLSSLNSPAFEFLFILYLYLPSTFFHVQMDPSLRYGSAGANLQVTVNAFKLQWDRNSVVSHYDGNFPGWLDWPELISSRYVCSQWVISLLSLSYRWTLPDSSHTTLHWTQWKTGRSRRRKGDRTHSARPSCKP